MNIVNAIIAGLIGTVAFSALMVLGPRMGMPRMAIWEVLGSMFNKDGHTALGWGLHFMIGAIFGVAYAALWSAGLGSATWISGAVFGAVHWLAVGLMMGGMPMMHAGIRAGSVQAPGVYMLSSGGAMGFMGGLIGHVLFGLVVGLVYGLLPA